MGKKLTVYDINGTATNIEVLANFKIEEYNKNYVIYCINDDGVSETVDICISEIDTESNPPRVIDIKPEEVEAVLNFYDYIKDTACGTRENANEDNNI